MQALGSQHLEEVELLPPEQPCADEAALLCFKRLGERVTLPRALERQVVELNIRVALLNRSSQIDRPQTVPVADMT